jgi:exosortase J
LAVLLIAAVAGRVQEQAILVIVISPQMSRVFPPAALVVFAYGSGVVLLLGGVKLYRAALFPILLLWLVNPIPHEFNLLVDLPLQHASAHIARAFAMKLGHTLTPDHLRLMFTPDFGMFIAPGCNGIRGSVTMGFIALIAGYVYRFRWSTTALVALGAILLGYLFNFLRLCLLVLYYVVALHFPSLQDKAEGADYVIGAALFLLATLMLFAVIHRLRDAGDSANSEGAVVSADEVPQQVSQSFGYARLAAMGVVALFGFVGLARANAANRLPTAGLKVEQFPHSFGDYALARTWNESLPAGPIVYVWAQYAKTDGGTPVAIGVSPVLGWHDPIICHSVRGENPVWQGELAVETANSAEVEFSSAFYNDGVSQYLEASTECTGKSCGEFATNRTHFGFVYDRPQPKSLLGGDAMRPTRILLRVETINMAIPADTARLQLSQDVREFLAHVRLEDLTGQ